MTGGAAAGGCPTAWWGGIWEAELLPPHLYEYSWGTLGGCERKLRAACGWGRGAAPCFFFPGRSGQPRCCGDRLRTRILPPPPRVFPLSGSSSPRWCSRVAEAGSSWTLSVFLWVNLGSGPGEPLKVCSGRDDPGRLFPVAGTGQGVSWGRRLPAAYSCFRGNRETSSPQPGPKVNPPRDSRQSAATYPLPGWCERYVWEGKVVSFLLCLSVTPAVLPHPQYAISWHVLVWCSMLYCDFNVTVGVLFYLKKKKKPQRQETCQSRKKMVQSVLINCSEYLKMNWRTRKAQEPDKLRVMCLEAKATEVHELARPGCFRY